MRPDKYIIHDVYHVIHNLNIIDEKATKDEIMKYVKIAGSHNNQEYTNMEIQQCLTYLETIGQIKRTEDQYEVII